MNRIKSFVVAVIIVTCSTIVFSQNTEVTIKKNREFSEAVSLFDNQLIRDFNPSDF